MNIIQDRVNIHTAVPVQALRIVGVRDDGVRLGEAEGGGGVEVGVGCAHLGRMRQPAVACILQG